MRLMTWWVVMGTACLGLLLTADAKDLPGYLVMSAGALASSWRFERALHAPTPRRTR